MFSDKIMTFLNKIDSKDFFKKMSNKNNIKLLYISDSLGLSIKNHRGISNYSLSLVKMIKSLGVDITLLVERIEGYGFPKEKYSDMGLFSKIINSSDVSEIYRYFTNNTYDFSWDLRELAFSSSILDNELYLNKSSFDYLDRRNRIIDNTEGSQDLYPDRGKHLKEFNSFLWMDYIYSDAPAFCKNNLSPIKVDASNFDYVIMDAPHYVEVENIDRNNVFSVIHDVIPITDPTWSWDWRTMFAQKIKASFLSSGNYIFVSQFTEREFSFVFEDLHKKNNSYTVYPTISSDYIKKSNILSKINHSFYLKDIQSNKDEERKLNVKSRLEKKFGIGNFSEEQLHNEIKNFGEWNGSLPYVTTILADEERKNIPLIIESSKNFVDKLNFIIMGNINGDKYFNYEPENYPNVHFTGFVSDIQKEDILRNASAFVFPSISEGFGIPIVEGALYNLPIICSDIDIFKEIADNYAIYFDPTSTDSFSEAINECLSNVEIWRKASEKLKPILVERFSDTAMISRIEKMLS